MIASSCGSQIVAPKTPHHSLKLSKSFLYSTLHHHWRNYHTCYPGIYQRQNGHYLPLNASSRLESSLLRPWNYNGDRSLHAPLQLLSYHTNSHLRQQKLISEQIFTDDDEPYASSLKKSSRAAETGSSPQRDSIFIDRKITLLRAGKGGDGHVSFLRLPYVPKGGPDGGDGGNGGSVYIEAREQMSGKDLRVIKAKYLAPDGEKGKKKQMHGKNGKDLIIQVPLGTVVRKYLPTEDLYADRNNQDEEDIKYSSAASDRTHKEVTARNFKDRKPEIFVADLQEDGQRVLLVRGGRGGYGNEHFANSRDQAPTRAQPGRPGEEAWVNIELKSIADIGLVGYPNAGKSTFLSQISRKKPAISTFPFTTLSPNLGVVSFDDDPAEMDRFTVADLPGLIEGAHANIGLGHNFLRHIERTQMLVYVLDMGHYENIGLKKENFHDEGIPQLEEATTEGNLSGAIIPDQFDLSSYFPSNKNETDEANGDLDTLMEDYDIGGFESEQLDEPSKKNINPKRRRRMSRQERAEYDRVNPRRRRGRRGFKSDSAPEEEPRANFISFGDFKDASSNADISFGGAADESVQNDEKSTPGEPTEKFKWSDQPDVYQQDVRRKINQVKHQIYLYKPWEILEKLEEELEQYQPGLSKRAKLIVANKMDVPGSDENLAILKTKTTIPIVPISAQEGVNVEGVVTVMRNVLREQRNRQKDQF